MFTNLAAGGLRVNVAQDVDARAVVDPASSGQLDNALLLDKFAAMHIFKFSRNSSIPPNSLAKFAPLPGGCVFLNVIEAVWSFPSHVVWHLAKNEIEYFVGEVLRIPQARRESEPPGH